ncbi:MAG: ABC transporter substrate-binding protein [Acidimicrobiales bacterium]
MATTRWFKVGAASITLALFVAACGGGRNDESSSGGGGGASATTAPGGGFSISTADCAGYEATKGVTDDSIKLGSSFPQSGLYSAFAEISKGYEAYFKYVNDQGGVNGKKIEIITKDDQYDSGKTKSNTQELTQKDGVFAMYNVVGTASNLAIRDDLGEECIPNLYAATGSQLMGNPAKYPWLIGSIPTYATESAIFADYLKTNKPDAKVAILAQNDDLGVGYTTSFKKAIEGTGITVVKEEKYNSTDPDVKSQITTLSSSGADTALIAATALKCPQALNSIKETGWSPLTYISATCTSNTVVGLAPDANVGVLSSIYLKDPSDPEWANDPAMQEFQTLGAKYGLSPDELKNGIVGYGWTMGALLVNTLKQAGTITRQSVMQAAYSLKNQVVGLLLPGISINTDGVKDPYPIEQMQIGKYGVNGPYWDLQGQVVSFEGKTGSYAPNE